jgi:hypothetical protein
MNTFTIEFNDLSFEKQQEIIGTLTSYTLDDLKTEAKEHQKDFKTFMIEDYSLSTEHFDIELQNFIDDLVQKRIAKNFRYIEILL